MARHGVSHSVPTSHTRLRIVSESEILYQSSRRRYTGYIQLGKDLHNRQDSSGGRDGGQDQAAAVGATPSDRSEREGVRKEAPHGHHYSSASG